MQNVVIEEPYEFIPPSYSDWWPPLIQLYLSRYLRKAYGITSVECRGVPKLKKTLDAGHGVLLCAEPLPAFRSPGARHAVPADRSSISCHGFLAPVQAGSLDPFRGPADGGIQHLSRRRRPTVLSTAIDILVDARRPLIVFAEGAVSRHNDQLMPLMDGTAFIARQAARRRKKRATRPLSWFIRLPFDIFFAVTWNRRRCGY